MEPVLLTGALVLWLATGTAAGSQPAPGEPRRWGNATYVSLAVGEGCSFLGKRVGLVAVQGRYCTVQVDGVAMELVVARRALPQVIAGIRVFVADNRPVASCTVESRYGFLDLHGAATKDALLCLSDPSEPLLDPERFTFPIDRTDGYEWSMEEDSHMLAFLGPDRSHEGIDLDMHDARGGEQHTVVAVEDAVVRWIEREQTGRDEACALLESLAEPGTYYVYQHLNRQKVFASPGQRVSRGQKLAYIWGDNAWGHLHFSVVGYGRVPLYGNRYRFLLNSFPQMYELCHGDLAPRPRLWSAGEFLFNRHRATNGNRKYLSEYDELVGYGWLLGAWNVAGKVDARARDDGLNARLSRVLWPGTPAECRGPAPHYDFEVAVPDGQFRVKALLGDQSSASWQKCWFEETEAGTFDLAAGQFAWTDERVVQVIDGRLTVRLELREDVPAGLSELHFVRSKDQ